MKKITSSKFILIIIPIVLIIAMTLGGEVLAKKKKKSSKQSDNIEDHNFKMGASQFSVSPPLFDLQCVSGETKVINVKLENPHGTPAALSLIPAGITLIEGVGLKEKPIASLPSSHLARNVTVETPKIVLPAKSFREIAVSINIPKNLEGTQYLGLTAANVTPGILMQQGVELSVERREEFEKQVGLGMVPAIGILVKCHMKGTLKYSYSLEKIEVIPAEGNKPMSLKASVKNLGNAEMNIYPFLILIDGSGKVAARMKPVRRESIPPSVLKKIEFVSLFAKIPKGRFKATFSISDSKYKLKPTEQNVVIK